MHRLSELAEKLTPTQLKEVEDFAEFLITRCAVRNADPTPTSSAVAQQPPANRINVDALIGMFAGMGGDKSDKELIREAWDEIAAKYD
jgi:hypothetical protein